MDAGIKIDVDEAISAFREYSIKAESAIEKAVLRGLLLIERDAKQLFKGRDSESIPNEPPRVQTGRTRASITHRLSRTADGVEGEAGTNVEYAYGLEHGTSTTYPHPFMGPALDMNEDEINRMIGDAIDEAANSV